MKIVLWVGGDPRETTIAYQVQRPQSRNTQFCQLLAVSCQCNCVSSVALASREAWETEANPPYLGNPPLLQHEKDLGCPLMWGGGRALGRNLGIGKQANRSNSINDPPFSILEPARPPSLPSSIFAPATQQPDCLTAARDIPQCPSQKQ